MFEIFQRDAVVEAVEFELELDESEVAPPDNNYSTSLSEANISNTKRADPKAPTMIFHYLLEKNDFF